MSTRIQHGVWSAAQAMALVAFAVLVIGLWFAPEISLRVFWGVLVPMLPALFLVHPGLWRNVCPLSTLNMAAARVGRRRRMSPRLMRAANAVGIGLFVLLVPMRGSLFDVNGQAAAVTAVSFALVALLGGAVFDRKAGFCNAICPLLPLERLYGQAPALTIANPRCPTCTLCVRRGCIDLAPQKSVSQILGRSRRTAAWLLEPFGAFAASFPGFVVAFFTIPSGAPVHVALAIALIGSASSWLMVGGIVRRKGIPARRATPMLAAVALVAFYWFTGAKVAGIWNGGAPLAWGIRGVALGLGLATHSGRFGRTRARERPGTGVARPVMDWRSITGQHHSRPTPSVT